MTAFCRSEERPYACTVVHIGTESEYLRLTRQDAETVLAELEVSGLSATRPVVQAFAAGVTEVSTFLDSLERDWRGWEGERAWTSLEDDLTMQARHTHGHVQLRVTLRCHRADWGNDGWRATADLTIDPGEQLSRIAADARSEFSA